MGIFMNFYNNYVGNIPTARPNIPVVEKTPTVITEEFFYGPGTLEVYKMGKPISFTVATEDGNIETLEGVVPVKTSDRIITGPKGERYPISKSKFETLYTDNGDGTATPKLIVKKARAAIGFGTVSSKSGRVMNFNEGEDMIIRHGPGDYGVVKNDIFKKTYKVHR